MKYQVTLNFGVDFAPQSEVAEILQNVRTIISTRKGSVPLDRDFGISWEHLDKPLPLARALMQAGIIEAIEKYEPRARVNSVEFDDDEDDAEDGVLHPRVIVEIVSEEEEDDE